MNLADRAPRRVLIPGTNRATAHPTVVRLRARTAATLAGKEPADVDKAVERAVPINIRTEDAKARKGRRRRIRPVAEPVCGAVHPDAPNLACGGGFTKGTDGKPVPHRGDHRARPLVGVVVRWSA